MPQSPEVDSSRSVASQLDGPFSSTGGVAGGARRGLSLSIFGQSIRLRSRDPAIERLFPALFGEMAVGGNDPAGLPASIRYTVERPSTQQAEAGVRRERSPRHSFAEAHDSQPSLQESGDILFLLEADLVVALQKRRSDLFFLHCAALEWEGRAYLFAGESGAGKSTTAWALLHHGFGYLSDELAPVDLESLVVLPFPRALCLKSAPAPPYVLPPEAIRLGHRIHAPCASLPAPVIGRPLPIGAIFLLEPRAGSAPPSLRTLDPAEAAARLYVVALNALAHSGLGLDAAVRIAQGVPCRTLRAGALPATCDLILRQVSSRH